MSAPDAAATIGGIGASRGRVLIVDDDAAVRTVTTRILERYGFAVTSAEDGASGLAVLARDPDVELVVLDMTMPGMSSPEVARSIAATYPRVGILVMSGYQPDELSTAFAGLSILGYLTKPMEMDALVAAVASALEVIRRVA